MIKKYYAYMGSDNFWMVKRYHGDNKLLYLIKLCLEGNSSVLAYFMPFEVNVSEKQWETLPEGDDQLNHPANIEFCRLMNIKHQEMDRRLK